MDDAIEKYTANISRLSQILPGYDWLCKTSTGQVKISLIDVQETGHVHVYDPRVWGASSIQRDLYERITDKVDETTIRYIVVEVLIPEVCKTIGAAFDLDPQFFIDHLSGQVVRDTPPIIFLSKERSPQWNAWNLNKSFLSFRWYRPVTYDGVHSSYLRHKTETQDSEMHRMHQSGEGEYQIRKYSPNSYILRSKLDLSQLLVPGFLSGRVSAIEERVSIYPMTRNGRRYVIILSDPLPECRITFWRTTDPEAWPATVPPHAQTSITPLYARLVPRLPPNITSSLSISQLPRNALGTIFESLSPTVTFLRAHAEHPINDALSLEGLIFHVVISDTLGLLHILDDLRDRTVMSTASASASLDEILSLRTFIATLESHIPGLSCELTQALRRLLELFPAEVTHQTALLKVEARFQEVAQSLKGSLDSITGTVQFMESQLAITEAQSISRLTELAFLFIPLSFAATLFSMQVRELSQPPPVAYFVAFALPLSATTYALRALARSSWLQRKKERNLTNARRWYSLPPGAPVGNRAMLAWILPSILDIVRFFVSFNVILEIVTRQYSWLRLTLLAVAIFLTCMVVPSLAILWTRQIGAGLKIGLTFAIILSSVCLILMVLLAVPVTRAQIKRLLLGRSSTRGPQTTGENGSSSSSVSVD